MLAGVKVSLGRKDRDVFVASLTLRLKPGLGAPAARKSDNRRSIVPSAGAGYYFDFHLHPC